MDAPVLVSNLVKGKCFLSKGVLLYLRKTNMISVGNGRVIFRNEQRKDVASITVTGH